MEIFLNFAFCILHFAFCILQLISVFRRPELLRNELTHHKSVVGELEIDACLVELHEELGRFAVFGICGVGVVNVGIDADGTLAGGELLCLSLEEGLIAVIREITGESHGVAEIVRGDLTGEHLAVACILHKVEDGLAAYLFCSLAQLACELISA